MGISFLRNRAGLSGRPAPSGSMTAKKMSVGISLLRNLAGLSGHPAPLGSMTAKKTSAGISLLRDRALSGRHVHPEIIFQRRRGGLRGSLRLRLQGGRQCESDVLQYLLQGLLLFRQNPEDLFQGGLCCQASVFQEMHITV